MKEGKKNGLRKRKAKTVEAPKSSEFNSLAVKAAALAVKGREIQNGKRDLAGNDAAIVAQATRVIARKEIKENEATIFNAVRGMEVYSRFGKSISTIAALRSQCNQ